jgi:hypothetical protein
MFLILSFGRWQKAAGYDVVPQELDDYDRGIYDA